MVILLKFEPMQKLLSKMPNCCEDKMVLTFFCQVSLQTSIKYYREHDLPIAKAERGVRGTIPFNILGGTFLKSRFRDDNFLKLQIF